MNYPEKFLLQSLYEQLSKETEEILNNPNANFEAHIELNDNINDKHVSQDFEKKFFDDIKNELEKKGVPVTTENVLDATIDELTTAISNNFKKHQQEEDNIEPNEVEMNVETEEEDNNNNNPKKDYNNFYDPKECADCKLAAFCKGCNECEYKEDCQNPNLDDEFTDITNTLHELYLVKNHDYGSSFDKTFEKFGLQALVIRLSDKINRLEKLAQPNSKALVKDESVKDTLMDIANYAILGLLKLKK